MYNASIIFRCFIWQGGWSTADIPLDRLVGPGIKIDISREVSLTPLSPLEWSLAHFTAIDMTSSGATGLSLSLFWRPTIGRTDIPRAGHACSVHNREYWIIYRGPCFPAVIHDLAPSPPPLPSASCLPFSIFLCVAGRANCLRGEVGGRK